MTASAAPRLTLARLESELGRFGAVLHGDPALQVSDVTQDSRAATPGCLFAVRGGERTHGRAYVDAALANGAVALLCEPDTELRARGLPRIEVTSTKDALGECAEAVHARPSRALRLVGITGTNGKTTTAQLVAQCLEQLGEKTAVLGTLGFELSGERTSFGLTTPEADAISRYLRRGVDAGATHAAMEVSSHALALGRVQALSFAVGAFSNLTQDHLDFHGTLAEYGEAKAKLFLDCRPEHAVINTDDAFGAELARRVPGAFAVGKGTRLRCVGEADAGTLRRLELETPHGPMQLATRLFGAHNVDNWLLCLGILHVLGIDLRRVAEFSPELRGAAGRFERCDTAADDVRVIVDYAHTPDALSRALAGARTLARGRLVCVFGCGGDRDRSKRGVMGEVAAKSADFTWITNDNPRSEAPEAIAASIEAGLLASGVRPEYTMELDRERAIQRAVVEALPGDLILIAGKGHEDHQIIGSRRLHFDDREEAARALELRRVRRGTPAGD